MTTSHSWYKLLTYPTQTAMLVAKKTLAGPRVLRRGEQKPTARQSGAHTARLLIKQIFFKVTRGCRRATRPFPINNISTCWSVFPSQPWHHGPSESHHRKMLVHVSAPSPSNSHRPALTRSLGKPSRHHCESQKIKRAMFNSWVKPFPLEGTNVWELEVNHPAPSPWQRAKTLSDFILESVKWD